MGVKLKLLDIGNYKGEKLANILVKNPKNFTQ